jgi:drug/metabolite transporter (DMT)-like permease|tara:strand:- start:2098 stop:2952 length:855 start_codon:yes stop_codon:yes gene_type:complete
MASSASTSGAVSGETRGGRTPKLPAKAVAAVVGWYCATVLLITTNKFLMGTDFGLPVFLTFLHMLVSFLWCEFSANVGWSRRVPLKNWRDAGKVFALSQTLAVSVALAVASFKYVEVSLEQALAASTPAFTAAGGVLILGKQERSKVWLTLVPVMGGAMLAAGGEPKFHALGVCLVFASNVARGVKSCLQELLLNKEAGLDSMSLLRWMSLFSMLTLLPMSCVLERPGVILEKLAFVWSDRRTFALLAANCGGAFLVNLTQFAVTSEVGALSMQVLGNVKVRTS